MLTTKATWHKVDDWHYDPTGNYRNWLKPYQPINTIKVTLQKIVSFADLILELITMNNWQN